MTSLKCKLVNEKDKQAVGTTNTPNNKLKKRKASASARSPESAPTSEDKGSNGVQTLGKIDPATITED